MATRIKTETRIHLIGAQGDTGETFYSTEELHHFYYDAMGEWPSYSVKRNMSNGGWFTIGSRDYRCEKRKTNNINAA